MRHKQNGFTILEVMIVLVVVAILMKGLVAFVNNFSETGKRNTLKQHFTTLQSAARSYAEGTFQYTGISLTALITDELIDANFASLNPYGGSYTVTTGTSTTSFVISADGVTASACRIIARSMNDTVCSGTVLSQTFN